MIKGMKENAPSEKIRLAACAIYSHHARFFADCNGVGRRKAGISEKQACAATAAIARLNGRIPVAKWCQKWLLAYP